MAVSHQAQKTQFLQKIQFATIQYEEPKTRQSQPYWPNMSYKTRPIKKLSASLLTNRIKFKLLWKK